MLITVLSLAPAWSQSGIAFQQLRNATFQSTNYNPAWMPQGTIFLGLPAISGVNFYVNNKFSYNKLFTDTESGGKLVDIDNVINNLAVNNLLSIHSNISLFHLGVRAPTGHAVVLFANERIESDFTYPKRLIEWGWEGNGNFIGQEMNFSRTGLTTNYFREYGIAYAIDKPEIGLKLGIRAKMYQGLVNLSTPSSLSLTVLTENENFQVNLDNKNVVLRSAGIDILQNGADPIGYLIANNNRGFGVDLGFEKKMNRYYTFALGVTDIGYISWKEGILNRTLSDTTFRYTGLQLKGINDLRGQVEDSLINRFSIDESTEAYTTLAVSRINGNFIYTPLPYLDVITTASVRMIQWQPKVGMGVGLRAHLGPKLIASANVTRLPQQWTNIGAGLALTGGPVQLYAAVDKVLGYSVPNMQWAQGSVGINFVFGNKSQSREARIASRSVKEDRLITEPKGVTSGTFMGSKVQVKRSEGLYTFINKQERSEARTITPVVVNGDHERKGVQSATGKSQQYEKHEGVRTASGQVYKNDYKPKKIGSATSSRQKSFKKKKSKIRSISGGAQRSGSGKKTKIRSASGRSGD